MIMEPNSPDTDWDDVLRRVSTVPTSSKPSPPSVECEPCVYKRTPCRYGRGCTHISDPIHQERFAHPAAPILDRKCRVPLGF